MIRFTLIEENDIILFLPRETEKESLIRVDFVRYHFEIIEDLYFKLITNLHKRIFDNNSQSRSKSFILTNDAWLIIDTASKFKNIVSKLFPSFNDFDNSIWEQIRLIRNTYQHIEERVDLFDSLKEPNFGYLTASFIDLSNNKDALFISFPGYIVPNMNLEGTKALENSSLHFKNITSITLNSIDRSGNRHMIELLVLFEEFKKFKNYLTNEINNILTDTKLSPFDWSNVKDISIFIKQQN